MSADRCNRAAGDLGAVECAIEKMGGLGEKISDDWSRSDIGADSASMERTETPHLGNSHV